MAEFNENQNGVFGGVPFGETNTVTGFFDGITQNSTENTTVNETTKNNVFGSWKEENNTTVNNDNNATFKTIGKDKAITKQGLWSKIRAFLFQEIDLNAPIKVELTPYQQKVEDEINEFLHQEVSFKGIVNFFKGNK